MRRFWDYHYAGNGSFKRIGFDQVSSSRASKKGRLLLIRSCQNPCILMFIKACSSTVHLLISTNSTEAKEAIVRKTACLDNVAKIK